MLILVGTLFKSYILAAVFEDKIVSLFFLILYVSHSENKIFIASIAGCLSRKNLPLLFKIAFFCCNDESLD
jgi:hypothetical protein